MRNQKLQCLLLGRATNFIQMAKALTALDTSVQLRSIDPTKKKIEASLKLVNDIPLIVFVSDENPPHLKVLADLIRQHCSNAIIVIVTQKTTSIPINTLYSGIFKELVLLGKTYFGVNNISKKVLNLFSLSSFDNT